MFREVAAVNTIQTQLLAHAYRECYKVSEFFVKHTLKEIFAGTVSEIN